MRLVLLGMNHRTAPLEVREQFALDDPSPGLAKLVASDEVDEAVLLSTCNRVEVLALTRGRPESLRLRLRSFIARDLAPHHELPSDVELDDLLYEHSDARAVQHVFRVASSIDSLVVGEPQILGQLKDAYRAASDCAASGVILDRLFSRAFATAKRVRRETQIAERPVSVARVAVDLAKQVFESFQDKSALLVGAGEMMEIALEALRGEGLAAVRVANRTLENAEQLAERHGASAHGLDDLPELLVGSDVVLSCIGGETPLIDKPTMARVIRARRHRPIFVIDIGVPRNVAPEVNELDDVYLFDLDDLSGAAAANAEERRRETVRAEAIVLQEQQRFEGWLTALQAVPTIRDLRTRAEAIREQELDRNLSKLGLDESQREGVEALTRGIVNKLLHAPLSRLRREAEREEGMVYLEAARLLFALDDEERDDETDSSEE